MTDEDESMVSYNASFFIFFTKTYQTTSTLTKAVTCALHSVCCQLR